VEAHKVENQVAMIKQDKRLAGFSGVVYRSLQVVKVDAIVDVIPRQS